MKGMFFSNNRICTSKNLKVHIVFFSEFEDELYNPK